MIINELVIGIIGGLIASLIVGTTLLLYKKIIFPKIEEIMYKGGIDFSGEWEYSIEDKDIKGNKAVRDFSLNLEQHGFRISGNFIINNKFDDGSKILSVYNVTGIVANNFITAHYLPKSRKRNGAGTLLLEIGKGGKELLGINTGVSVETGKVKIRDNFILLRKGF
ncbi:MAG: hypothetical protein ACRBF0_07015 [Calditrichia bacterium]